MQKRYNVFLPEELGTELERVTQEDDETMTAFFRRAVKLALVMRAIDKSKDSEIQIKTGDKIERLIVVG